MACCLEEEGTSFGGRLCECAIADNELVEHDTAVGVFIEENGADKMRFTWLGLLKEKDDGKSKFTLLEVGAEGFADIFFSTHDIKAIVVDLVDNTKDAAKFVE